MDAKTLIIELGDYAKVAARLSRSASTVANWKSRNRIPRERWPDMIEAYPRRVTVAKLLAAERSA
jgi:transposase